MARAAVAPLKAADKATVFLRLTQTIDTGYRGDNNHVAALKKGTSRRVAQLINLLIYVYLFLNIGISSGNIGLRLVVVIIADKVLYRIIWEKLFELGAELGSQCLVMANNQGRPLHPGNDIGHSEGLAATSNAQ